MTRGEEHFVKNAIGKWSDLVGPFYKSPAAKA